MWQGAPAPKMELRPTCGNSSCQYSIYRKRRRWREPVVSMMNRRPSAKHRTESAASCRFAALLASETAVGDRRI